jgi:hypothetical protein
LFNNIKNIFNFESTNVYYFRKFNKNFKESKGKIFFINKFGNKNKNKTFYVIKRSPGAGIFSNLFYVLQHLYLIRNKRFIPIVDMNNFITLYNEKKLCNKTHNAWEYYFDQLNNYSLQEVYKSQKVIITSSKAFSFTKNMNSLRKIWKTKIKFNQLIKKNINLINKNIYKDCLGVHFTTHTQKFARKHPVPPTIYQMKNLIEKFKKKFNIKKVFLSTFIKKVKFKLSFKFKNNILFNDFYRSDSINVFNDINRNNHRFLCGMETIMDVVCLSSCKIILASESNVIDFIKLTNPKKRIYLIDNGRTPKSYLLSRFSWYYKFLIINFFSFFKKNSLKKY